MNKNILIIENDYGMADSLRDILEMEGHEVTLADGGEHALAILQTKSFDCFLVDLNMPGLNGFDTMKAIKEIIESPFVIFLTGFSGDDLIFKAQEAGAAAILTKPIDLTKLLALLNGAGITEVERRDTNTIKPVTEFFTHFPRGELT